MNATLPDHGRLRNGSAQKKAARWSQVADALERGEIPKFFLNARGYICIDDGATGPCVPAWLAAKFPADVIDQARAIKARTSAEDLARSRALAAKYAAESEAKRHRYASQTDQTGWLLLAGEDTEVVARGTLRDVEAMRSCVTRCKRDSYTGRGCWVIVSPDGSEYEAGYFDRDLYW